MIEAIIGACVRSRGMVLIAAGFLALAGIWAIGNIPLDAIPDLSDVQVIVFTEYPGQSPTVIEDQVTYPLATAMLAVPYAKVVRGYSYFGYSFVYIIFEDGTDLYWARSRVLEYLNFVQNRLPPGVSPALGPDATGVGWVYEYELQNGYLCPDHPGKVYTVREVEALEAPVCPEDGHPLVQSSYDLSELRSVQDWYLRYELMSVPGVSEVASIGGFVKQYQVVVDPDALLAYGIPLRVVRDRIRASNADVGGKVIESAETEFMILGRGYLGTLPRDEVVDADALARRRTRQVVEDLRSVSLGVGKGGTPVYLRQVAEVNVGPDIRRGLVDSDGRGEVVAGIVVMRFGENALKVIEAVKARLDKLQVGLPLGMTVRPAYDRSHLILRAVENLRSTLVEEMAIVGLVCIIFLLHLRSAFVAFFALPLGVLTALLVMYALGLNANIMSLGGIAIAIGVMVDASVVLVENAHKHLERDRGKKEHWQIIMEAAQEVGPALFYSLLVITVSFMPVFGLGGQSGRLFRPLAFTKTFSMASSAILAVTVIPALMVYFIRGRIPAETKNPVSRFFIWLYRPFLRFALRWRWLTIFAALAVLVVTVVPYRKLGSEFMPPLYEGDLLYMPTTDPGISITKARELLQLTDRIISGFGEVHHVMGKVGRAETATDPAPLSMMETIISLRPRDEWPEHDILDHRTGKTVDRRPWNVEELIDALNRSIQIPGLTNAWTMPIKTRVDMLSTGIKTPIGVKLVGDDLKVLEGLADDLAAELRPLPGTLSVYHEKSMGGNYLEFDVLRDEIARYGLSVQDVQNVVLTGIGGMDVTRTVEGLERYPVNLRYPSELRDNLEALKRVLVATPTGSQVPLGQLVTIQVVKGPPSIKSENARRTAWIYVDIKGIDVGTYVARAQEVVAKKIVPRLPAGYNIIWSGQYEYMGEAAKRMGGLVPLTVMLVFMLLFLHFRTLRESLVVMLSLPFAVVGGVWLMWALDYNLSVAVQVGFIALAGLAAETGVVMLVYLRGAFAKRRAEGTLRNREDVDAAITEGALERVRPVVMTVGTTLVGLMPVMLGTAAGSQVMKRIAAPMVGGLITSTLLTLLL
ncbi:MAG: efflux RND transporter permease subunit, partial [Planctomycetota bacterium]